MIICVCNNINETAIRRAVAQGCASFDALQMELGVGACCGQCKQAALDTLAECNCKAACENHSLAARASGAVAPILGRIEIMQSALRPSLNGA
jgi:bacterioferritin-associated ferredoxin